MHSGSALVRFILHNSLLLVFGTATAIVWANIDAGSYDAFTHPLHFWVNDVGMVFFFALAAGEVFEAMQPGGALASPRQSLSPLVAAVGGTVAPALIFASLAAAFAPDLMRGWAIPCATDIAFSAMVARIVFGDGHPAVPFLLLLAIADDALGMVVLAVFYPTATVSLSALVPLMSAAVLAAWWLRRRHTTSFWPYLLGPGMLSWAALHLGGFHPALALVPVVPFMPHLAHDIGLFDSREDSLPDTLNRFQHWWAVPVQGVLFLFGLANAGVPFTAMGFGTYFVAAALLVGKPVGIVSFAFLANAFGARLPAGLRLPQLVVIGMTAAIGFTVALFFATAAFPPGAALAQTKMGALLSFAAAPVAILAGRLLRVRSSSREN